MLGARAVTVGLHGRLLASPLRCAAGRLFTQSSKHTLPSSTSARKNREMFDLSEGEGLARGRTRKIKNRCYVWKNFRVILLKGGPHTLAPYYEGGSNRMLGCPSDPGDRRKHQVELVGTYRGNLGRGIACRSSQRRERERERESMSDYPFKPEPSTSNEVRDRPPAWKIAAPPPSFARPCHRSVSLQAPVTGGCSKPRTRHRLWVRLEALVFRIHR